MAFTEDFDDFINQDTPGFVSISILGNPPVSALFDKNYQTTFDVEGSRPVLHISETNLGVATRNTPLVIKGGDYKVSSVELDGTGMALVILEEV